MLSNQSAMYVWKMCISIKTECFLHLKTYKANPFREGVDIHLFSSGASVCPVISLDRYVEFRNKTFERNNDKKWFFVMEILTSLGCNSDLHNGHSFRIGTSTTAGSTIEYYLIQTLGRWSSPCYTRYIITSMSTINQKQQALLDWMVKH